MNEEINQQDVQPEIQEEVVQPEVVQPEVVQPEEPASEPQQEDFSHNAFEENVKNLREAKEVEAQRAALEAQRAAQAEKERDQLAMYVQNIQQQVNGGQPPAPQNSLGIEDDDYVEGKHLGQVTQQMQQMQAELQQWKNYSEETTAELKLNNEFSDFSNIVTKENVDAFIKQYPEMRGSIQNNDPLYNRGKATYRLIKKFMGDSVQKPINKSNQARVQNNTGKPRPTSSIKEDQNSPLSQANLFANGYNEEVGEALEREMYDAIKKY